MNATQTAAQIAVVILYLSILAFGVAIYLIPAINAKSRGHPDAAAIFMTNLFFGWTLFGWLVALIWSFTGDPRIWDAQRLPLPHAERHAGGRPPSDSGLGEWP